MSSPLRSLRSPWWVAVATTLAACFILLGQAAWNGYDPTTWIVAGSDYANVDRVPDGAVRVPGTGYDGQFFFALAQDPLASDPGTRAALDTPAYRTQRVLLPASAWMLSAGGQEELLVWVIPLLNVVAMGLIAFAAGAFALSSGLSAWFGMVAGLLPGLVLAAVRDLAEPMALAALALGLLAYSRRAPIAYGVAMTAALLGRESLVLVVIPLFAVDLLRSRWALAIASGIAMAILAAWQGWLWGALGSSGITAGGQETWGWPLEGPMGFIGSLAATDELTTRVGLWALATIVVGVALAATALVSAWRQRDALGIPLAVIAVVTLFFGPSLWGDTATFPRNLAVLMLLSVIVLLRDRPNTWQRAVLISPLIVTVLIPLPGGLHGGIW